MEAALDISFTAMVELQRKAEAQVRANPAVEFLVSATGGGNNATNAGRMFITLKPKNARGTMSQTVESLRKSVSGIAGLRVYFNPVQNLRLGGRQTKSRYQYTLQSVRADELNAWAEKLLGAMRDDPLLRDLNTDAQLNGLQATLRVDRDRAAALGIDMLTLRDTLYGAFGDRQVGTIYTPNNSYQVIMRLDDAFRSDESAFDHVKLRNKTGELVPLKSIATIERSAGPTAVNHQGQLQAVTISFNLAPGAVLGDALKHFEVTGKKIGLPASIITSLGGDAAVFQQSQGSQTGLLILALLVIYVLLGVLYESYIHPITILAGIPSAAVGALMTLRLFNIDLTLIATIGILLLIGIVKKNAIMMIDFAIETRHAGETDPVKAIRLACVMRFRPIMMTTLAAMMGAVPIAAGWGAGAELRQPLGLAVVGGLMFSQLITLFITPVLYLFFDGLSARFSRKKVVPGQIAAS